jgi:hypothetical protein
MKMQNRPVVVPSGTGLWPNIIQVNWTNWYAEESSKEIILLENLILTFGRLGFTKCYYEDFDCKERYQFLAKLKAIGYDLIIAKRQRHKKKQKPDWKIQYDRWEANLLAFTDHHYQSRQSIQALMLVEKKSTYLHPSSFLVDSS